MDHQEIYKVVMKLIGEVKPFGSTDVDQERLENLNALLELIDSLLVKVDGLTVFRNRQEQSVKDIGDTAYEFTREVYAGYKEVFEKEVE